MHTRISLFADGDRLVLTHKKINPQYCRFCIEMLTNLQYTAYLSAVLPQTHKKSDRLNGKRAIALPM
jgi:hypothetical protein